MKPVADDAWHLRHHIVHAGSLDSDMLIVCAQEPSQWLASSNLASLASSVRSSSDQARQQSPNNGSPWVSPSMPRRENLPPAPPLPPRSSIHFSPPLPRSLNSAGFLFVIFN